ncbi:MAG: type II toxin-antitoxin system HipA family toxin, partial [Geobacteraceae bacterium]|nr:type II toxin-antitoxin system HipA family toxin [Geobacteraceae bacterium]
MNYHIAVWLSVQNNQQLIGEMVCEIDASGKGRGAYRYTADYLADPSAFPLDPVSLPLRTGTFETGHPGIFKLFEDSLPDDWGRRLLVRKHGIPRHEQNLPALLLALGSTGLGALSYSESGKPENRSNSTSAIHLEELVREAELFEQGKAENHDLTLLFSAGSSPGGARPKALVYDDATDRHYLAKFPSTKDSVDVVRLEAATMGLAKRAGLTVPDRQLIECAGKPVFLIERFDITPSGRRHMISFQTLLKMEGYYVCRYQDLLDVIRKFSAKPDIDSRLLYRQMVFNAVIGNTDDHLKNFWMTCDPVAGWRLSPSFDLVPDIAQNGDHVLRFDLDSHYPGREKLEKIGRGWGIHKASEVTEEVYAAVAQWKEEFAACGVCEADIIRFNDIEQR